MSTSDQPHSYFLHLQGQLSPHWMNYFAEYQLRAEEDPGSIPNLYLSGVFQDQAALIGALQTLYNLGCTLISVERLDAPPQ